MKGSDYLIALFLLPVLADKLEDLEFSQLLKKRVNNLIKDIRAIDILIIEYTPNEESKREIQEQQIDFQRWFLNMVKENLKN